MENEELKRVRFNRGDNNGRFGGLFLVFIGVLFLLHRIPATSGFFPHWFFTWPTLLIGIGIFSGIKNGFRNIAWLVFILIGSYALAHENNLIGLNLRPYAFPIGIILVGLMVMFKRNQRCKTRGARAWQRERNYQVEPTVATDDVVQVNSMFGSVERNVFSKDFKGGSISCFFGGAQVNFSQADFQGTVVVDVSLMFGGADIIIPSNWNLKNEMSVVFGGIEDRRSAPAGISESGKTLILKGNVMFGGVEIKSY
jgi:predicted membrane protein